MEELNKYIFERESTLKLGTVLLWVFLACMLGIIMGFAIGDMKCLLG